MDDELHPAGLIEEPLGHNGGLGGQDSEHAFGLGEVLDELLGCNASGALLVFLIPRERSERGTYFAHSLRS